MILKCSKRCWALWAAYYNMFSCIPAIVFFVILLYTYCTTEDFRPNYADSYITVIAKNMNTALMFIWLVMELTGIIICIRLVMGIKRERVELVTQYVIWKVILTLSYGIYCVVVVVGHFMNVRTSQLILIIYPGLSFAVGLILFIIVFVYYQSMPEDSSSEEEGF